MVNFKLGALFILFSVVHCAESKLEPATCPAFNPKKCNPQKNVVCCQPPKEGELCPTFECFKKKYKSPITGKKCNTKCPIHCDEDNMNCEGSYDKKGCYRGDLCLPKIEGCNKSFCPLNCPEGHKECPSGYFSDGCPMAPMCVPELGPDNCPNHCPHPCKPGFIECQRPVGLDGCPQQSLCIPSLNNESCPNFCPMECPVGFIKCSKGFDVNGCSMGDECIPEVDPVTDCPNQCHTCPPGQLSCPVFLYGGTQGCPVYSPCSPIPKQLAHCDSICPPFPCDYASETACPLGTDDQGCPLWFECLSSNGGCPTCPPIDCQGGTSMCDTLGQDNSTDNCGNPIPFMSSFLSCSLPAKNGCPESCLVNCGPELQSCLTASTPPGCLPSYTCHPLYDENNCPASCPGDCPPDTIECLNPASVGCPPHKQCLTEYDYNGCPQKCYPSCDYDAGEQTCQRYVNESSTCIETICMPRLDENNCTLSCPDLACYNDGPKCTQKDDMNPDSCPTHEECSYPSGSLDCPHVCNPQCHLSSQQTCPRPIDGHPGCVEPYCFPYYDDNQCPTSCPNLTCPSYPTNPLQKCTIPPMNGCPAFEVCHPQVDGETGCPNFCPMECPVGFIKCSKGFDVNGCSMGDECIPEVDPVTDCPNQCHTCPQGQLSCPLARDAQGCPVFSPCSPIPKQLAHCDSICPPFPCDYASETACPLGTDDQGCPLWFECLNRVGGCPTCPPIDCQGGTSMCDAFGQDNSTDYCLNPIPFISSFLSCSLPAKNGCPESCPVNCGPELQSCLTTSAPPGCLPSYTCHPLYDENNCPASCPGDCPPDTIECLNPTSVGCPPHKQCLTEYDYNGCPQKCYPSCDYDAGEQTCQRYVNESSTCIETICMPRLDENNCTLSCPDLACYNDGPKCTQKDDMSPDSCPTHEECSYPSGSFDCPHVCNPQCHLSRMSSQQTCLRPIEGHPGCMEPYCFPYYDDNQCPTSCPNLTCPSYPNNPMQKCTIPPMNGCPAFEVCHPQIDGETGCFSPGCPIECPPTAFQCKIRKDDATAGLYSCTIEYRCIENIDDQGCVASCPAICSSNEKKCFEPGELADGSLGPDCPPIETCEPIDQQCPYPPPGTA